MPINFAVKAAITGALMAAQVALGAMRKIEGPRLDNRKLTTAEYGTALVRGFWGICRFVGCPMPWAEDLREKKIKSKTKGGKYAEYKYFWTGMIHIADCEIDAVRKIWLDNHLVYQVAGTGPIAQILLNNISPSGGVKVDARNIAIYLGTEDQDPDPRMEAWFEDHADYGPNSCSAHRGTAYAIFKDIPVEKFGNRPPTVDIEAARSTSPNYLHETLTSANSTGGFVFNGGWGVRWRTAGQLEWYDAANRVVLGTSLNPGVFSGSVSALAMGTDGTAYCYGAPDAGELWLIVTTPLGVPTTAVVQNEASVFVQSVRVFGDDPYGAYDDKAGYLSGLAHVTHSLRARDFAIDAADDVWGVFQPDGASDELTVENFTTGTSWTLNTGTARSDVTNARMCFNSEGNIFVDGDDGNFYIIDPSDGSLVDSGSAGWDAPAQLPAQIPGRQSFWDTVDEYSLLDGSLLRNQSLSSWGVGSIGSWAYDPVTHAIWGGRPSSSTVDVFYLDRITVGTVTLGTIVNEVSGWVGIQPDVTALTQVIDGYSVTPGSARDMIEPLLDIHDSICRTHDFTVQFIKHGTSSLGTIDVSEFVRESDDPRYEIDEDTGLPKEIVVTYADKGKDHQQNTVTTSRHQDAVDTSKQQAINLETYAGSPDGMQQLLDRYFRAKWNRRHVIKNAITAKLIAAECGDVYNLDLDGTVWSAEVEKQTFSATSPKISCEWRRTFPSLNTLGSGTGPPMLGDDEDEIIIPAPTKAFFLDIPLTSDVENAANPLIHFGAGSYGSGAFPGAAMYEGDLDGEDYTEFAAVPSDDKAVWGYATTALGTANPNLWDRGNTLTVRVFGGTLDTLTEAAINADPTKNMFALKSGDDWELGNFTTATLTASTTAYKQYDISGFLRGRRGTEWAIGDHTEGDDFILVSSLDVDQLGLSEVGDTLYFKGQSYGRDPEMAPAQIIEFEGQSLKPYAPVIWHVEKDSGTGDISIEIRTRTRVGGAWNGSTIPTGETIAEYEFDVYDGATFKRTLESTDKTFTYSAADQTTDFGSEIEADDLEGFAYQLSADVGRGFARAA